VISPAASVANVAFLSLKRSNSPDEIDDLAKLSLYAVSLNSGKPGSMPADAALDDLNNTP
jgi:hypothetical protein